MDNRLLVSFPRVLRSYVLDGSDGVELRRVEEGMIERVRPSPDGTLIAINEFERWDCTDLAVGCSPVGQNNRVIVLDATTGAVILETPQTGEGFDGFIGVAGPAVWTEDGEAVFLDGYTYADGGDTGRARVALDGTIEQLERPNRFVRRTTSVVPGGALGCGLGAFDG
jgi:hypothetical protein